MSLMMGRFGIPAGSGHWFSQIDGAIDHEVMRVDPDKLLSLK